MIRRRFEIYSCFTGIPVEELYTSWRYYRDFGSAGEVYGCGCGCGGDQVDEEIYELGVQVSLDIFSQGS